MAALRSFLMAVGCALAGCATPPEPYQPPAAGAEAQVTVRAERMWAPNRVTLYLIPPGADVKSGARKVLGQIQGGEHVRREVLAFDAQLPAGVPLRLVFEYRYDAGAVLESGCDFPVNVTLAPAGRYLVEFIRDTRSCAPRFYVLGQDGARTEIPLSR